MFSTYKPSDVKILLKDISNLVTPLGTKEREKRIQSGTHYSEMLPIEYTPSDKYLEIFHKTLKDHAAFTAKVVASVAEKIWNEKGANTALVSLARAGTPIGILIKRYIKGRYKVDVDHYTISIIRDKGIDKNAMTYILARHKPSDIQFIDGWTGKGAIQKQLTEAMKDYPEVKDSLAVLSDPAGVADKCGTHEDFLIASSCLNSTVSGLLSRTFYRKDIIDENDFHGALFYKKLEPNDLTYYFIKTIEDNFTYSESIIESNRPSYTGICEAMRIANDFGIKDINFIKPSIGETTRVLLRRVPYKILVYSKSDYSHLGHIYQLAKEKGVDVIEYPLTNYKSCGIIKNLADN